MLKKKLFHSSAKWPMAQWTRNSLWLGAQRKKSLTKSDAWRWRWKNNQSKKDSGQIYSDFLEGYWTGIYVYCIYIYTYMIIHHVLCVFVFDCDVLHRGDVSGFYFHNGHTSAVWTVRYRDHIFKIEAQKPKAAEVQRLANIGVPWKKIHQLLDMEKIMYNQLRFFKIGFHIN